MTKKHALSSVRIVKNFCQEKKRTFKSFEEFAAKCIMTDLSDRREIKYIFAEIRRESPSCYRDILKTWSYIITECFDDFTKEETHELIHGK